MSNRKQIEGRISEFALRSIQRRLSRKSPEAVEVAGRKLGRMLAKVGKKRYETAVSNLKMALPEITDPERVATACFEHFGLVGADFLTLQSRTAQHIIDSIETPNLHVLEEALELQKGCIMITGHFGNWERMAAMCGYRNLRLSVVARDADQAGVTGMVNQIRNHFGTQVISRGNAARPMLEALRRNEMIGILPDQNSNEAFIPFFGKPAGTVLGPGVLYERTGSPVVCFWCIRTGPVKYRMEIEWLKPERTDTRGEGTMLAIHAALEGVIRRYPEQWLWFHDRWRNARRKGLL